MTKVEILQLFSIINEMNEWLNAKRERNVLAQHIQFPKTPPALSESIALNLLIDKDILPDIEFENLQLGGNVADIIGEINKKDIKIEIKATVADFQYFGEKDIKADYLIWINLVNPLRHNNGNIDIYVLPNPKKYFKKTRKISLNPFLTKTKSTIEVYKIDIFEYLNR